MFHFQHTTWDQHTATATVFLSNCAVPELVMSLFVRMPEQQFQDITYFIFCFFCIRRFSHCSWNLKPVSANYVEIRNYALIISTFFKHLSVQKVGIFKASTGEKGVILSSAIIYFTPPPFCFTYVVFSLTLKGNDCHYVRLSELSCCC